MSPRAVIPRRAMCRCWRRGCAVHSAEPLPRDPEGSWQTAARKGERITPRRMFGHAGTRCPPGFSEYALRAAAA